MTRREFIAASIALASTEVALSAPPAAAAQASGPIQLPPRSGAAVWLDLDQAQLDAAYTQSYFAPNQTQVIERWTQASHIALRHLEPPRRAAYGSAASESLDVYRCAQPGAPIAVFIHGGAWRGGSAREYAFVAEPFVHAGAHCVIPDFSWVQDVGGDLMQVAEQVRRSLAWVWRNAASFGGDRSRIHVFGQSSGAHLAGCLISTQWADYGLPAAPIRAAILCSGMYDLAPVRLSVRSSYVRFTDESVQALSPQRHLDQINAPLIVAHGDYETPEFQRQARDFVAALRAANKPVELLGAHGYNHFELMETLGNPYGVFGRAALAQMGLGAA